MQHIATHVSGTRLEQVIKFVQKRFTDDHDAQASLFIALHQGHAKRNATTPVPGPYYFANILMKRVTVQGFIIMDFARRYPEGVAALAQWVADGRIKCRDHVVSGLENAPEAINELFTGGNIGKLLVQVSPEP